MPTLFAKDADAPKPKSPAFFPSMNPQPRPQDAPTDAPAVAPGPSSSPGKATPNGANTAAPPASASSNAEPPKNNGGAGGSSNAKMPSASRGIERLLSDVKRDFDRTVDAELKRLENEFGDIVDALSRQLLEARESVERLSEETAMLRKENQDYQKKSKLLRELQEKLKDI